MQQNQNTQRPLTPLWVISLFLSLTEAVLSIALINTSGGIQVALTAFVLFFPIIIAIGFFLILWFKPHHMYAPTEYGQQTSAREYIDAITQRRPIEEKNLYLNIQNAIQSTLTSDEVITGLSEIVANKAKTVVKEDITHFLTSTADKTIETIRENNFITINTVPLLGVNGDTWDIPFDRYPTVSDLLDGIWFSMRGDRIPPSKYGEIWMLRDSQTGKLFRNMGRNWAATQGGFLDERSLKSVGIKPGMRLEAIKLS